MDTDGVTPSPSELWGEANAMYPDDQEQRRVLYLDLMRVWGHVIPRKPGDDSPVFKCGDSIMEWLDGPEFR